MMQSTPDDINEQHVVNYVPDEICVVVTNEGNAQPADLYEQVRARLNAQIATLLKVAASGDRPFTGPLGADLTPTVLAKRFAGNPDVLQPLRRATAPDSSKVATLPPFIPVRNGRRQHLYFAVGGDSTPIGETDLGRLRQGLESVRELVLLLNRFALTQPAGEGPAPLRAVSPNWLTIAHQFGCGCPAGLPLPVESQDPRFPFQVRGELGPVLEGAQRGEVIVAVLDTCPSQASLDAAAARFTHNALLNDVHKHVQMDSPSISPPGFASHLAGCLPRLQWDMQSGPVHDNPHQFAMADHGLFVTGVVYDILAGRAPVHLIRVLNDFGVGDAFTITHALAALPALFLRSERTRLVVNLSLGFDLPIPARLLDRWLPNVAANLKGLREHAPDVSATLELLHANVRDIVRSIAERGVLIVASTGNDALRRDVDPGDPPPPRYPARYNNVLGVAATRSDLDTAADYSNRGELTAASWPGHISTFGGNVVPAVAPDRSAMTDPVDSVVGIFSNPSLPGGAPNASGWVRWSGTSFSTPLIAAVAARLWMIRPELGPLELMALLRTFARHPHGGADPDAPLEVPVVDITQS
jgi:subtilase family protein